MTMSADIPKPAVNDDEFLGQLRELREREARRQMDDGRHRSAAVGYIVLAFLLAGACGGGVALGLALRLGGPR